MKEGDAMKLEKFSAGLRILDSGSAITFQADSDMKFALQPAADFSFNVILRFASTPDGEAQTLQEIEGNNIIFNCLNYDNAIGTGMLDPLELAQYGGKKIFLNFWVNTHGEGAIREVAYTFYMEQ